MSPMNSRAIHMGATALICTRERRGRLSVHCQQERRELWVRGQR